jgi:hypothetical protein
MLILFILLAITALGLMVDAAAREDAGTVAISTIALVAITAAGVAYHVYVPVFAVVGDLETLMIAAAQVR